MSRPPDIKRLRSEDFPQDEQALIGKLSYPINTFWEQVISLFSKNIDFENLNRQLVDVDIEIDSSGAIVNPPRVKYSLRNNKISGSHCVGYTNLNDPSTYPTSHPSVAFSIDAPGVITIRNVTGLQNSSKYRLTLELIG